MKKMGSVKDLMGKIPGMSQMASGLDAQGVDADGEVKRIQGMIDSMTRQERANPHLIDISRRRRIAARLGRGPVGHLGPGQAVRRAWPRWSSRWPPCRCSTRSR